ncbi:MAG: paraquat-inducible protein A [Pseudomonas sp.]
MTDLSAPRPLPELPLHGLAACPECDLLMHKPVLALGEQAQCPRCDYELFTHRPQVLGRSLALVLAALLLYIPANFLPILRLNLLGNSTRDTMWGGVLSLYNSGMQSVALVVFLCSMAIPLLKLLCQLLVLLSIRWRVGRTYGLLLYRIYHHLRDWGMLEVYLLGILVAIVKLMDIADLSLGIGLGCFIGLIVVQIWLEVSMSPQQIWLALSEEDGYAGD